MVQWPFSNPRKRRRCKNSIDAFVIWKSEVPKKDIPTGVSTPSKLCVTS